MFLDTKPFNITLTTIFFNVFAYGGPLEGPLGDSPKSFLKDSLGALLGDLESRASSTETL